MLALSPRSRLFFSGVNSSLASRLRHITIYNTKLAVNLCLAFSGVNGSLVSRLRHITICNTKLAENLCLVFSGVNGSLALRLCHITICNTKLAVNLCQFLMNFGKNVSKNVETSEFLLLRFVRHSLEHHVMNDVTSLHRLA